MIEVQLIARDSHGRTLAFTLGMGTHLDRAKRAAATGMLARLADSAALAARVHTFAVEVL